MTCSCTIDRVGLTSQFDITVIEVVQDAYLMVQQLNRFNRPPRPGARYLAAYVGQQYVAGLGEPGVHDERGGLEVDGQRRAAERHGAAPPHRGRVPPARRRLPPNYVNGWLIYELPVNRPAYLVWNYNFVGERGIWFALQ